MQRIAIVILNWNGRDDTIECVDSVRAIDYPNFEILIVDNGSLDGSVSALRKRFPDLTVLETGQNLGYAGGNNVGIVEALRRAADFVFLLNNDAVVDAQILNTFVRATDEFPDAGVFSAKIYYHADPGRLWYAGARWCNESGTFEHVGINELDIDGRFEEAKDTEHACGCAMLLRSGALRAVGLLESRFFLTFEETDWCFRARKIGYRCIFVPGAKVWHKVSVSFGGENSSLFRYFYTRNRLLWSERHLRLSGRVRVWRQTVSDLLPAWDRRPYDDGMGLKQRYWKVTSWVRSLLRDWSSPPRRAMRRAVIDYTFRNFGDCPQSVRDANAPAVSR
jgi:GT2 family glycosyltransferase